VLHNIKLNQQYNTFRGDSFPEPDWADKLQRKNWWVAQKGLKIVMNVLVLILFLYSNDKLVKSLVENIIEPNY